MIDRKSLANPFRSDVVTSPTQPVAADVLEIHRKPFELCREGYSAVVRDQLSWSVLLHGEAGCGKTHLLSRLRRWLAGEMDPRPAMAPAAFVAIRMAAAPSQIWRHVRRQFAEALTRRAQDESCCLDGILHRYAARRGGSLEDAFERTDIADLRHDLAKLLEHFHAGRQRRLCRAWLNGESLSEADLQLLNLPPSPLEEIEQDFAESNARQVVLALIRLSAPSPVVFCFDQVEALGISQQNRSFGSFSRMVADLVDGSNNVMVVSTILATFLRDLHDGSMHSDYQRMSKQPAVTLEPLSMDQARLLIDSRLALVPELSGKSPIAESSLRSFFAQYHGSCVARRVIHEAWRLYAEWQQFVAPPPVSVDTVLHQDFERRWANSHVRKGAEHSDEVLAHGLPVVLEMLGQRAVAREAGVRIARGTQQIEVVFANQSNTRSFAAAVKRLLDRKTESASLCLVRDRRLAIPATAKATHERLRQMEAGGGRLVKVEVEALAALDALRGMLSAATSGELSANGEAIPEKTVRDWLARNMPRETQAFASSLLNTEEPVQPGKDPGPLLALIDKRKVVSVDEVVLLTSWPAEEIEDYANTHPLDIRWFGGTRPVVCQTVAAPSTEATHREP